MICKEIHRHYIELKDKELNDKIRHNAFREVSDEETQKLYDNQKEFVLQLRTCMAENKSLESLIEYKDKIMSVLPFPDNEMAYLLVFYDKDVNNKQYDTQYDAEKDLFYIEIEEEEKQTNE